MDRVSPKNLLANAFMRYFNSYGAPLRNVTFISGAVLGSLASTQQIIKRCAEVAGHTSKVVMQHAHGEDGMTVKEASLFFKDFVTFMGTSFNQSVDDFFSWEELAAADIPLGSKPSPFLEKLFQHNYIQRSFLGSYPTFESFAHNVESCNLMTAKEFTAFCHTILYCVKQQANCYMHYKSAKAVEEKMTWREAMGKWNACDTGVYSCFFAHLLDPDPAFIEQIERMDYETLKTIYPEQSAIGESWQMQHMVHCVAERIFYEGDPEKTFGSRSGKTQPDLIIAALEKEGVYEQAKAAMVKLVETHENEKTIPFGALPQEVQKACHHVLEQAKQTLIDAGVHHRHRFLLYKTLLEDITVRGGISNRAHLAR